LPTAKQAGGNHLASRSRFCRATSPPTPFLCRAKELEADLIANRFWERSNPKTSLSLLQLMPACHYQAGIFFVLLN
jgi:hypothetical protein